MTHITHYHARINEENFVKVAEYPKATVRPFIVEGQINGKEFAVDYEDANEAREFFLGMCRVIRQANKGIPMVRLA